MVTSPLALLLPKLVLRHWTAQRSARSARNQAPALLKTSRPT